MDRTKFSSYLCLGILFLLSQFEVHSTTQSSKSIRMVQQFKKHSPGLMDLSSDGQLLLMHEWVNEIDKISQKQVERLRILDAVGNHELASIKLVSDEPRIMLFLPGSQDVLLSGHIIEPSVENGYIIWNPLSRTFRSIQKLSDTKFQFIQFLDKTHILGLVPEGQLRSSYVEYNLSNDTMGTFDIRDNEGYNRTWERGIILSPDCKTIVGKEGNKLTFRKMGSDSPAYALKIEDQNISSCSYSPNGQLFVVISEDRNRNDEQSEAYLAIYETATYRRLTLRRILTEEIVEKRGLRNIGYQLGISPDSRWLVVGYDRLSTRFLIFEYSQAKYALYELSTGLYFGTAEHPRVRKSSQWADISPVQSGRLKFSPDSESLYTTSAFTRQWELPEW